jgi:hypothetical protein
MKTCKRKYLKQETIWNYKATDPNGYIFYYVREPVITDYDPDIWDCGFGSYSSAGLSKKVASGKKDWTESLRRIVD